MFALVAASGCGYVLMHIEGPPREDRPVPRFDDPVEHLKSWFAERVEAAIAHGVASEQIAIDPGIDFDLGVADGLALLRRLAELGDLGLPLYVSLSRKDLLGAVLAGSWEGRLPPEEREAATAAATTLAVWQGGAIHRLHDASALQAMRIAGAVSSAGRG
jgi:dihydropteroate synthase